MTGEIAQLDEMLELLFWMEGEGLEESATLSGIARFLAQAEAQAEATLGRLVARGDVVGEQGRYALTEIGRSEAARRFVEDFSGLVAQGHGECNDPQCDCRTSPGGAADCHGRSERAT